MAENSRSSKLSSKDDECVFTWKLFTGWDFMIGNIKELKLLTIQVLIIEDTMKMLWVVPSPHSHFIFHAFKLNNLVIKSSFNFV